ncbi:chemotaxis protein CheA [Bdellovibrionota bacterium FG-1]
MDDFELELKNGFLEEASQLLTDAEQCFLTLETAPEDASILEKIFRLAHNLKGSAKAVGFDQLGEFTHELESYLLKLKSKEIPIHQGSVSLLLRCNDHISKMVDSLKGDFAAKIDGTELLADIRAQMEGRASAPAPQEASPSPEPVEVTEPVMMEVDAAVPASIPDEASFEAQAEISAEPVVEDVTALMAAETEQKMQAFSQPEAVQSIEPPKVVAAAPPASNKPGNPAASADESIRVSLNRIEKLMNFVGELVIMQTVLREQASLGNPTLRKAVHQLGKVTKEVQDISMSLRMVPLKQTFQKMTRIVRDTSSALGKSVQLVLQGEDTEVDKTVLENLGDPLVHLIRNAVDHGVESAEERQAAGKTEPGTVWLNAYHQSGSLVIEIRDNGGGLDPVKLTNIAIQKGILKPGTQLSEKDAHHLIFAPGFSTKAQVTDISGRGVGMDVVRTNIEHLQGDISIETQLGKGTCFKIRLPLTLAIVDGMVIRSGTERYIIPLSHVHESVQPTVADVHFVTGAGEIFSLRGENLPLYRLSIILGQKGTVKPAHGAIAIVVRTNEKPFAILVDDIIGQHQVVIKRLGEEHRALKGFSGSAILGDGRPALILELPDLIAKHKPLQLNPVSVINPLPQVQPQQRSAA